MNKRFWSIVSFVVIAAMALAACAPAATTAAPTSVPQATTARYGGRKTVNNSLSKQWSAE